MGARATVKYAEWILAGNVIDPKNPSSVVARLYLDPINMKWGYKYYTGEQEFGLTRRAVLGRIKMLLGENCYIYEAPRSLGFDARTPFSPEPKEKDERISARIYKREMKKRTKGEWNG